MTSIETDSKTDIPVVASRYPLTGVANPLRFVTDPFVFMRRLQREYGEIVTVPGKMLNFTFVFSPELTRQVLTNPGLFHNGEVDDMPLPLPQDSALRRLTKTLNTINDDKHKQQRRLMLPAFHRKRIEGYHADMVELTRQKLAEWQPGQHRDMLREMKELTLAIAVKTLLGLDPNPATSQSQDKRDGILKDGKLSWLKQEFEAKVGRQPQAALGQGEATRQVVEQWIKLGSSLSTILLLYNIPGLPFQRMLRLSDRIEILLKSLIAQKRSSGLVGDDVLSSLMQAHDEDGGGLSEEELVAETLTLFVAGHETTATALTWTLFLLIQHSDILADLLDELDANLHGDFPDLAQLSQNQNQLPLLDRVIKESMRILSPFLFGFRYTTADCNLGNFFVPKGSRIAFAPSIIHHLPEIYSQPEKFNPARWETLDVGPYEYLPFAAGPRMCIGTSFALMEMKVVLAYLLQQYRLVLRPGAKIDRAGFLLTYPRSGLPVQLEKPDRCFVKTRVKGNIHSVVAL